MTAYRRRTGRALPCVNSDNTDYREHRMNSVYVRASMAIGGRRARNSRSMQPIGYYCFKCGKFWTENDRMEWIVRRVSREAHTTTAVSL
jgi:hypothetical protein